jgi:hypothetical protein
MKQKQKLASQEQEQVVQTHTQQNAALEFATAEELLRYDAAQTKVPPGIAQRLQKSAAGIRPPGSRSWWKNLLGG